MKIVSFNTHLALFAALAWGGASADEVTVNLTARVMSVSDPGNVLGGQVAPGQLFTGFYRYDSSAEPRYPGPNIAKYSIPGYGGGLRLANDSLTIESQATSNPIGDIEVVDNPPGRGADWFLMSYSMLTSPNAVSIFSVDFRFYDTSGRMLNSTELPTSAPELQNYWDRTITIMGGNSAYFYVTLEVESAEFVPPPVLEVSPQAGSFLPQQRFDAALYLPAGSTPWNAEAYSGSQALPLSYPGNCELAPPNSSGLPTIFCPDAHAALATVPNATQVEWRVYLLDGTILKKVVDWKRLE